MKNIWKYLLLGVVVAGAGLFLSDIVDHFLNGLEYGTACVLGMGLYLCILIVVCTGLILSKVSEKREG